MEDNYKEICGFKTSFSLHTTKILKNGIKRKYYVISIPRWLIDHYNLVSTKEYLIKFFSLESSEINLEDIKGHSREEFDNLYLKAKFKGIPVSDYKGYMFNHYNSTEWGIRSMEILKRDNDLCQICLSKNIVKPANIVAHRRCSWFYTEIWLDPDNLYASCQECENERHNKNYKNDYKEKNENYEKMTIEEILKDLEND